MHRCRDGFSSRVLGEANMKHHVAIRLLVLSFGIVLTAGCDAPPPVANSAVPAPPAPPPPPGSAPPAAPAAAAAPAPAGQAPLPPETKVGVFAGSLDDLAARPQAGSITAACGAAPQDANTERVKAEKGVGIKGRSLDQYQGVVVTPVKAYFAARERIFFDVEFKGNYDRWRVSADKAPKDFDELKAQFLDPLGLTGKLPKLPQGHKYVWDGAKEELQVERPKQQ